MRRSNRLETDKNLLAGFIPDVLSIQEGKVLLSTILRKLDYYSRKKLFQAFQEQGRMVRTFGVGKLARLEAASTCSFLLRL